MRIGISTSVVQGGRTGIAQYVFSLLQALLARNEETEFFLFLLERDLPFFEPFANRIRFVLVPESCRKPVKDILWHQTTLPGLARDLKLDVLHIPSYRRLVWRSPCPRVATIHDLAPFHVPKKYDLARMAYGKVVARALAARQERVIAVSQNTARDIVGLFGVPAERVSVIYNGIDHVRFHPRARDTSLARIRQRFGLQQPFFLYVARLEHPGKNHVPLISAFERFKQSSRSPWQLVFGGSDWHGAEAIHQVRQRSRFCTDIRCLGFVPDADLPDLYRAADVFVYPSLYEGFGMPPIEAMACGCPVVSSDRGSLREVVGNAAAIIDPESVEAIAAQLLEVAFKDNLRTALRTEGLRQAARFDWAQTAAATLAVYRSACNLSYTIPAPARASP